MSHHKFTGDTVSVKQQEFISSVLNKHDIKDGTVDIQPFGKAGDNYVASMKRITVENDDSKKFVMIAKLAPDLPFMKEQIKARYVNEHIVYNELFPKYTQLENAADVPQEDRLKFPICYGSSDEDMNEIVLLEDLTESNFVMLDRFKSLTDETVRVVLKDLAKLHSLSYAFKNKEPETFETLKNKLVNALKIFFEDQNMMMFIKIMELQLVSSINDANLKGLLKGIMGGMIDNMTKNFNIDNTSRYSVIQHGDCWTNNFLFKLEDDQVKECCLIDYQQSMINSPVGDLHMMLFCCTDYATRSKHYHEWIDYYHSQLDKHLSNFGLKANFVYPRDQLDADLKRQGRQAFGLCILMIATMMRESQDAEKMNQAMQMMATMSQEDIMKNLGSMQFMAEESMQKYNDALGGLLMSFVELGYL